MDHRLKTRKDRRGVDLISDALPFGRLWYSELNAIRYAKFYSRSHNAVIRVYDEAGNVNRDARMTVQPNISGTERQGALNHVFHCV